MQIKDFKNINYVEIIRERNARLDLIRGDPLLLKASKGYYKNNPAQFINDWLFTHNPQLNNPVIPFILFPKQVEFINFLFERYQKREDFLVEKCREMGLTWLIIGFSIWLYLFHAQRVVSIGSRKEDLVDLIGDMKSIFEKIRWALQRLPIEFLPKGFDSKKHMPFMRIINPENGSMITGESGINIGRGGRSSIYLLDEFAHIEHADSVDAAVSENSECKGYISTPNGVGNTFYRKRHSGKIKVFTFNWWDDPRKDQAWFDKRKDSYDPIIFAQEILIDYGASVENVCIPAAWVKSAIGLKIEATGLRFAGLDVADEGGDANSLIIRKGPKIELTMIWKTGNTSQTARKAYAIAVDRNTDHLFYDSIGVGAGIKGEFSNIEKKELIITGVNVGNSPSKGLYADGKKNVDMFLNLKAQTWWALRRRFEKTFEHVNGIKTYPDDALISIPEDNELITELSTVKYSFGENGKIKIESKKELKARGIKSPNKADACVLAFAPLEFVNKQPTIRML